MPPESPAFDLRFARGRGALVLAHPMRPIASPFPWGEVTHLELALGALPSPVDLRPGAARFRHRQAALIHVSVRVDLDALAGALSSGPFRFRVLGAAEPSALSVSVSDGTRTVVMDLCMSFAEADLLLAPRHVRSGRLGAGPAWGVALRAMREAGASFDAERGALRVSDPVGHALREALIPHGYRLPESHGARFGAAIDGRALVLEASRRALAVPEPSAAFEVARALSPLSAALLADAPNVSDTAESLVSRVTQDAARELALVRAELGEEPPDADGSPEVACARLHVAVLAQDALWAAREARLLARLEKSDAIAAEALDEAAALAEAEDPATAADLLASAMARVPGDLSRAQHWLDVAARAPDAAQLSARAAEIARELGGGRPQILSRAALALRAAGDLDGARALLERARSAARDDPTLARTLAMLEEEREDLPAALAQLDIAAAAFAARAQLEEEALARFDAARLAESLGQRQGAIARLEQASALTRSALRARVLVELARLQRAEGIAAAAETELALVREVGGSLDESARDALREALRRAAGHAVRERASVRGRAIVDALERVGGHAEELETLRASLDALDLEGIDAGGGSDAERAARARQIAERMRATGRMAEAARALAQAGALDGDAATLRAAVELAERAGETRAALEVIDVALRVVGEGPARASLLERRAKLER